MKRALFVAVMSALTLCPAALGVGHWVALTTKPALPSKFVGVGLKLLLSDGTVMAQLCTSAVDCGDQWALLTPNAQGSYTYGTWSANPQMHYERTNYASVVLQDGRVFVIGGEYTNDLGGGKADIFDPTNKSWTLAAAIPSMLFDASRGNEFDDCQSMVLPDGKVLIAPVKAAAGHSSLVYDPKSNSWLDGAAL
jgi:hypothetical protein